MAGKESEKPPKQLKQDRLVEQLIPDPSVHRPSIQLTGWLGKSTTEGSWRLYLTPQLDEYVEFSERDVLHTQPVQPEQSLLGGTMVWLQAGAVLQHIQIATRQTQADFLSGGITAGFMPGTAFSLPMAMMRKNPVTYTRNYVCSTNPHIPACQLPTEAGCPSRGACSGDVLCGSGAFCPSGAFVCGVTAGCSVGTECSVGCLR